MKMGRLMKTPWHPLSLLSGLLLCLCGISAQGAEARQISVTYDFQPPRIAATGDYVRVSVAGCQGSHAVGEPVLPFRTAKILLPPGWRPDKAGATLLDGPQALPIERAVEFGRTPLPIGIGQGPAAELAKNDKPNPQIYGSLNAYPKGRVELLSVQKWCGYSIAIIRLSPVQYIPGKKQLLFSRHVRLDVSLSPEPIKAETPGMLTRNGMQQRQIASFVDNPGGMSEYASSGPDMLEAYNYLLVTSQALMPAFQPLLDQKVADGLAVKTETMENVRSGYSGVDDAEKLRNFLKYAYTNWGITYVLLAGDTSVVPFRGAYATGGGDTDNALPCDLYFSCLDGSWNGDADSLWGEPNDGDGGGDVDLLGEVYVGRAPVQTTTEANTFVAKIVDYEQNGTPNMYNARFLAEYLGNYYGDDAQGGDALDRLLPCFGEYAIDWLDDRPTNGATWGAAESVAALNLSPHIVAHFGHADTGYALRLVEGDLDSLTNPGLFLVNSTGCYCGAFDYSDCIAEELVKRNSRGAFAVLMNSRYGWFSVPSVWLFSGEFVEKFFYELLSQKHANVGIANQLSKHDMVGQAAGDEVYRWCYYEINLFGDPHTALKTGLAIVTSSPLPAAYVGEPYSLTLRAAGGTQPYSWSITAGTPPSELSFDPATGEISGTPSAMGDYQFTVQLTDSANPAATVTKPFDMTVTERLVITTPSPLPSATLSQPYAVSLQAQGGTAPYIWSEEGATSYTESDPGAGWIGGGTAQGWYADEDCWSYTLPWSFPYYGQARTSVYVCSNGYLDFTSSTPDWTNTDAELMSSVRIAPLWDDLDTSWYYNDDIFITESADFVVIRWAAHTWYTDYPVNVEAVLYRDGRIKFNYGPAHTGLIPTIGISMGDNSHFTLSSRNNDSWIPANVSSLFTSRTLPAGLALDATGAITGTPTGRGTAHFTAQVTDSGATPQTATREYSIDVTLNLNVQSTPVRGVAITGSPAGRTNYSAQLTQDASVSLWAPAKVTTSGLPYLFYRWTLNGVAKTTGQRRLSFAIAQNSTAVAAYRRVRRLTISGPTRIYEGGRGTYRCMAYFTTGPSQNVTKLASWRESSSYLRFVSAGVLRTYAVTRNRSYYITASYGGVTTRFLVTIVNR